MEDNNLNIKVELDGATEDQDALATSDLGDIIRGILADNPATDYSLSSSDTDSDTSDDSSCDSEHLLFDFETGANNDSNQDCDNDLSDEEELDEMECNENMIDIREVKTDSNHFPRQNYTVAKATKISRQNKRVTKPSNCRQKRRAAKTAPIFIATCENGMFSGDSDSSGEDDFDLAESDIEFEYEYIKEEII